MSQIERLYWIDAQIRAGHYPSASSVASQFCVEERQVYLDRRYLKERLNAPLATDRKRGGWYYTDKTYVLPRLILTEREVAAVRRAILAAREFGGVAGEAETLHLLAARVGDVLDLEGAGVSIVSGPHLAGGALVSSELFEACRKAVDRRQRLELGYFGAHRGQPTERTVRPLRLHNQQGEWYLIAWCELRQDTRDFHLSRIQNWRLLPEEASFTTPPDFDANAYIRQAFGMRHGEPPVRVQVRFSPYQSRWIREREYHPSQTLTELPDGGVLLSLEVTGTFEVRRWVMSYGAEAEVLEPQSLREEIAKELEKLQGIYKLASK